MDKAGAKGTGKWMSQLALDHGVPSTLVTEAVYARCLSAMKDGRVRASKVLKGPSASYTGDKRSSSIKSGTHSTPRKSAAMPRSSSNCNWLPRTNTSGRLTTAIAMLWRGGCIIRAVFLDRIKEAFDKDPKARKTCSSRHILPKPWTKRKIRGDTSCQKPPSSAFPFPAFAAALAY